MLTITENKQSIGAFDEATSSSWLFVLDWQAKTIELYKNQRRLAVFKDCLFPPSMKYLNSLTQGFDNVRAIK